MNVEKEIFEKSVIDTKKLIEYGFVKNGSKYLYSKVIMDDKFRIEIEVYKKKIRGRIIDLAFNEEYLNYRLLEPGLYASKVLAIYKNTLIDIRNNCFINNYFVSKQANYITCEIYKKYGVLPNFKFKNEPHGVFINEDNGKWFGIIMMVDKSKLTDGGGKIEILNLKLAPDKIQKLLKKKNYYQAYHMNKRNWLSIILNESLTNKEIMEYINESYNLTRKK